MAMMAGSPREGHFPGKNTALVVCIFLIGDCQYTAYKVKLSSFQLILLGQLFDRVDLIKLVSNVRLSVRPSVCLQELSLISVKFGM